ncbi:aspartate carbamoyltransferase catalytic subunit [Bacillaceae bacterium S4-13-58]
MKHFTQMSNLSEEDIFSILKRAQEIIGMQEIQPIRKKRYIVNAFFEPSTRTKMSFEMAERKLGLDVLPFQPEASSERKGESLYDTIKTLEAIGVDAVVIRHSEDQYYQKIIPNLSIPVINAGDGKGEHPTQCLLDLLTIFQEFKTFQGKKIVISGDIKHSRVARSNALTLHRLGADVMFAGPDTFQDPALPYPVVKLDQVIETVDVCMMLRVQHERHSESFGDMDSFLKTYGLTEERMKRLPVSSIIMHPAPINRGVEIDDTVVESSRSRIFKQMRNGVAVRMAVLEHAMELREEKLLYEIVH